MARNASLAAAEFSGMSLFDAETRKPINPVALRTAQKIEMTKWEIHDMAVQIVRDWAGGGFQIASCLASPGIGPSMCIIGKAKRPKWVPLAVGTRFVCRFTS